MYELCQLISQRVLNQKEFLRKVLKSSKIKLQEYTIKSRGFYLKNSK